jgi:plasmid stabilization system protein ParE
MYRVDITDYAEWDMRKAAEYISINLHNRSAAEQLLNDAEKAIYTLEEMPFRYPLVADEVLASQGFRFFPVHKAKIGSQV